jgi:hypothetical protein
MQQKSHESLNDLPNEDMGSCSEKNRAWHSMGIKFSQIASTALFMYVTLMVKDKEKSRKKVAKHAL